jgi:hypothetical protein
MVSLVQRTESQDRVTWRFNANGLYSTKPAYKVQFIGSHADHEWSKIWQSKVWLLLQNMLWTADRIIRHGGQMNDICQLCRSQPETTMYMLAPCSFTRQIWGQIANWIGITLLPPPQQTPYRRLKEWWRSSLQTRTNAISEAEQKFIYTI